MLLPALRARAILLLRCNDKAPQAPVSPESPIRILCKCFGAGLFGEAHLDDSWFIIVFATQVRAMQLVPYSYSCCRH